MPSVNQKLSSIETVVHEIRNLIKGLKGDKHTSSGGDNTAIEHALAPPHPSVVPKIEPTPVHPAETGTCQYQPAPKWKTKIEIIGIGFGIAYAIVTGLLWWDQHQNFKIDQRAWIGVTEVATESIKSGMKFAPILMEMGKTPAINVTQQGGWKVFPNSVIPDIDYEIQKSGVFAHGVIFPGAKRELSNVHSETITPQIAESIITGSSVLYAFAEIRYEDVFSKRHATKFCVMLDRSTNKFTPCSFYKDSAD